MSDSLADLLATDAELDRIARREGDCSDLVLAELSLLAAALDDVPLPPVVPCASPAAMTSVRKGGWALTVTVALMVTSSGVAAAVSDNPLGPLHYVTTQVWRMGPHSNGKLPGWQLDGAMPITSVPGVSQPGAGGGTGSTAGSGSDGSSGEPGFGLVGRLGTPDARQAGSPGSAGGGRAGHGPRSGSGGRPPGDSGNGPQGINSRTPPPTGGRPPSNDPGGIEIGNGTGEPGEPTHPGHPGHQNQAGDPAYGRVPGTGAGHCRIDHPDLPGTAGWTGPATTLHPCGSQPTQPTRPGTTGPGESGPADSTPGRSTGSGGPGLTGSAPSAPVVPRGSSPTPTRVTPQVSGLYRWLP